MPRGGGRFVATVLFTDVVGSTEMASEVGDRRWSAVLDAYYQVARREVRRFHGREIDTAGDGFFAAFDAPNDGVRAATAIVESMWAKGVPIRAGLHAGECEIVGGKVGGIAVHIGARVAGLAGAGEVVVTSTVRDLAAGSALRFQPLGARELKGVPGEWSVFDVESEAARPPLPPLDVPGPGEPGSGRNRRSALIAGIAAAVLAVAIAVPFLFLGGSKQPRPHATGTGGGPPSSAAATSPASTGPAPPTGPPVGVQSFDVKTGAVGTPIAIDEFTENNDPEGHTVTSGAGFVWVADFLGNAVYKINPSTGTEVAKLHVIYPSSIVVEGSNLWAASGYPGCTRCQLVRFDVTTNRQVQAIDLEICCGGMVVDRGFLWALGTIHLYRVDLGTGKVASFDIGGHAIAAGAGKVWILDRALATLTPVDESSGRPLRPIPLPGSAPTLVTFAFDSLWVSDRADGIVTRFPVGARGGTDTVHVGAGPTGMAGGADALWVANADDGTVTKVDPFGATVDMNIPIGGRPTRLTVAFGRVWTTNVPHPA